MSRKNRQEDNCSTGACCSGMTRREFLATSSAAAAGLPIVAGPFSRVALAAEGEIGHYVPVDKKLTPEWIASLTARGVPKVWSGEQLNYLAMPVGGIGAGQMYLLGDGSLACWHIYNHVFPTGSRANYQEPFIPGIRLQQGFMLTVKPKGGEAVTRRLDKSDFPNVAFTGRYPIGKILYRDETSPVQVELQGFSPFIPLNALDSTLPATILEFSLKNTSGVPVEVELAGWLENPVGIFSAKEGILGRRRQAVGRSASAAWIDYSGLPPEQTQPVKEEKPEVFADFEGNSYGDWKAEGTALGARPATGAINRQNPVSGFEGKGLVNSYNPDDDARGRLTSPEFVIRRPYINCLVGGGSNDRRVFVRLLVEGQEVGRAAGSGDEKLGWKSWNVASHRGKTATIEIVDNATGAWGHINVDQIEFADVPRASGDFTQETDFGTVRLALLASADLATADAGAAPRELFARKTDEATYPLGEVKLAALGKRLTLAAGETTTVPFVLCWHFPIRWWDFPQNADVGNFYATRFPDAGGVVDYVEKNYERLCDATRLYCKTFYDQSTLPEWLLERIGQTPSILATGTVHWRKNGRFWGWEGVGCCAGCCTHVWNYEHALARLFPELERSMRERQDFDAGLAPDGLVGFRGESTAQLQYAADGQCGTVLKAYREHLMSKDDAFLRRNYQKIKLILGYSISHDGNDDGIIEDRQHNTYDINFFGANPMIGSLYLAALLAGEQVAQEMGDAEFAGKCRKLFEAGRKYSSEKLYDGEYFFQDVDWQAHPEYQFGKGCLSDQLFGQGWAHQLGLEYVYPKEQVRSALKAVYKYNWTPDVGPQNQAFRPERWFARPGDAGLFICTWPKTPRPGGRAEVRYRDEVWTGIEYQVAGNLIYDGFTTEALSIIKGLDDRYEGTKQNPYNEVECGDHYARAMAGWGCLLAAAGFYYHGPKGILGFAPRLLEKDFAGFFSGAEGWGTLRQKEAGGARTCAVEVAHGQLALSELRLDAKGVKAEGARVSGVSGARASKDGDNVIVKFDAKTLKAGERLEVALPLA